MPLNRHIAYSSAVINKRHPFEAVKRAIGHTVLGAMPRITAGHVVLFDGGLGFLESLDGQLHTLIRVIS